MEADSSTAAATQATKFSRYRSVRKAVSHGNERPLVPQIPKVPSPATIENQKVSKTALDRGPSRYRRAGTNKQHVPIVPLPDIRNVDSSTTKLAPSHQENVEVPSSTTQKAAGPTPTPAPAPTAALSALNESDEKSISTSPQAAESHPRTAGQHAVRTASPMRTTVGRSATAVVPQRSGRYRSRTTSTPQEKLVQKRRSYDHAREEARLILEGEYDRLSRLKKQQEAAEQERRKRAEAKAKAEQIAHLEEEREERARNQAEDERIAEENRARSRSRSRKWTIGGGSSGNGDDHRSPSTPKTHSPQPSVRPGQPSASRAHSNDGRRRQDASPTQSKQQNSPDDRPSLRQRIRRPTVSRPKGKEPPVPKPAFEPKAGDGPPKTAVNGPAPSDAPVSAVNAGERRVELRYGDSAKITLPVTPTTTMKDLLNSASTIMSQPIDPRTAVVVETYYPLGLERPLRKYEHIRDVMNSWDSDTQNHLIIVPGDQISALGLELKEAPAEQPHKVMFQLHHSQKPGKWEKHWMTIRNDGQVTASTKENDVDAVNVFHLSDFDIYMPTRKQLKKTRPPKKLCFAIKSQQRSIMFESTENFVHFFSTNDRVVAENWYNAVQAWRSWYLVDILGQGTGAKPITSNAPAALLPATARPSTSHSRDSVPYQLGAFEPLLDFSVDAFKYGEAMDPKPVASPPRNHHTTHSRSKSISDPKTRGLDRHATQKRQGPPSAYPSHTHKPSEVSVKGPPSATDAAFTGKGLLARQYSIKKAQAEENMAFLQDTDNAFTGGLLSRARSIRKAPENANPILFEDSSAAFTNNGLLSRVKSVKRVPEETFASENSNDAFTGAGLLSVQRALTKKKSGQRNDGQPLIDMSGNSAFANGSLLRQVEGYEASMGLTGPVIDRSRGHEINAKTGET